MCGSGDAKRDRRTRQLAADGAPEEALTAIDPLTAGAHAVGETLVAIAHAGGLLYSAHLPTARDDDTAVVGPLPHLVPLLAATQRLLPHIMVVTDRLGAELIVVRPDDKDLHAQVEGDDLHVRKSAPGGWSQQRLQQRAEDRWESVAGRTGRGTSWSRSFGGCLRGPGAA